MLVHSVIGLVVTHAMLEFKLQSNVSVQARVFSMMLFKFQLTPSQEKENNGQQSPEGGNSILYN